jgi:hypothetical protein
LIPEFVFSAHQSNIQIFNIFEMHYTVYLFYAGTSYESLCHWDTGIFSIATLAQVSDLRHKGIQARTTSPRQRVRAIGGSLRHWELSGYVKIGRFFENLAK